MYVRVKDENGHEFDVKEGSRLLVKKLVARVPGVEPSTLPRPAKYAGASDSKPAPAKRERKSTPRPRRTKSTPKATPKAVAPEAPAARPDQSASDVTPDATEKENI